VVRSSPSKKAITPTDKASDDDDEGPIVSTKRKREAAPLKADSEESDASVSGSDDSESDDDDDLVPEDDDELPVRGRKKPRTPATASKPRPKTSRAGSGTPTAHAPSNTADDGGGDDAGLDDGEGGGGKAGVLGSGQHTHDKLDFLVRVRRDAMGRRTDHPDYNPRTLQLPADFIKKQTPAGQQWWKLKAENMDTVL
jgi:DNA mismatch repair protein MSH6